MRFYLWLWYQIFQFQACEGFPAFLNEGNSNPSNNYPNTATLAFNTQENVSENASTRSTMEQFHQTPQSTT